MSDDTTPAAEAEPTRTAGGARRTTMGRLTSARCTTCGCGWDGPRSLIEGTRHAVRRRHEVIGSYSAQYRYEPAE